MTTVRYRGRQYPASPLARGAAHELFADVREEGFLPNPRPGARWPFRRFVHSIEVTGDDQVLRPADRPLLAPVSSALSWEVLQRLSQVPPGRGDPGEAALIGAVRRTARIRRGTQMVKFFPARQLAGYLNGWPLTGFCHREYDVAHLRTPADLSSLSGETDADDVVFALRWRAVDPIDYATPLDVALRPAEPSETDVTGLVTMPPHDRVGANVLGTGFAPTRRHLIPEWVTAGFADLPLPANAALLAYTMDGTEVVLYTYLPEQHSWLRMCGPQWRHLLAKIPSVAQIDQEYFPVSTPPNRLVGTYQGKLHEAIADPPEEFRVAAKSRTARYPVDSLARRARYTLWRGAVCTVCRVEGEWRRLRLCHPDAESVSRLGASCMERGVYEAWAHVSEPSEEREVDHQYDLGRPNPTATTPPIP